VNITSFRTILEIVILSFFTILSVHQPGHFLVSAQSYGPVFFTATQGIGGYDLRSPAYRAFAFDYDSSGKTNHLVLTRPDVGTFWILRNDNGRFFPVYQQSDGQGIDEYDLLEGIIGSSSMRWLLWGTAHLYRGRPI
jgi:hypothetical protein